MAASSSSTSSLHQDGTCISPVSIPYAARVFTIPLSLPVHNVDARVLRHVYRDDMRPGHITDFCNAAIPVCFLGGFLVDVNMEIMSVVYTLLFDECLNMYSHLFYYDVRRSEVPPIVPAVVRCLDRLREFVACWDITRDHTETQIISVEMDKECKRLVKILKKQLQNIKTEQHRLDRHLHEF